jgi:exopolyphosphatase/guanosine-5'-triphosphate,3'-diphosphate pyrophosphatase
MSNRGDEGRLPSADVRRRMVTYVRKRRRRATKLMNEWRGKTFAALDLGTNNCRLLVARRTPEGFKVIDSFSRIVRLGEGLSVSGALSEAAMIRTIVALRICAEKLKRNYVQLSRSVATAACRKATNRDEFIARVREETGLELEIIAGAEEARLALAGCVPLFDRTLPKVLGFDIGGGSTELVWQEMCAGGVTTLGWTSLPVGVMTLTERHGSGPKSASEYAVMVEEIHCQLAPFCVENDIDAALARGEVQMVGTSGTVTTLAAMDLDLQRYDRARVDGAYIDFAVVRRLSDHLRATGPTDRATYPCIGEDRCELMIAGCAILEAICARLPVGRLRVADRGVREGILLELRECITVGPR